MRVLALIAFGIYLSSALNIMCSLSSWRELDAIIRFYNSETSKGSTLCTAGKLNPVDETRFSDLQATLRDSLFCVYDDFLTVAKKLWSRPELSDDEKKLIDDLVLEKLVDTAPDTECNPSPSGEFASEITPLKVIEELFSGEDRRLYYLTIYCHLTVPKAHFEELKTEIENEAKLTEAKKLIDGVLKKGYDDYWEEDIILRKPTKEIYKQLCEAFAASKNLKPWTTKKYLWSNVKCRAFIQTRSTRCMPKEGSVTGLLYSTCGGHTGAGYCIKNDDTKNIEENSERERENTLDDSANDDKHSAYLDDVCPTSPDPDEHVNKAIIYTVMATPIVLGVITTLAYIGVLVKTHRAKVE